MTVVVTGVKGDLAPRQEIRTMMQDVDLFTLYLLAVEKMKKVPETDPLSWFQIAGIHGLPYTVYDPPQAKSQRMNGGYCAHSSDLFPPWHRPYLALFEQTLATHVNAIANAYPAAVRQKYLNAAKKFRIPYWDWAYYADPPDVISREEGFMLDTPDGPLPVKNPLLGYTFGPKAAPLLASRNGYKLPWSKTLRWPDSWNDGAKSQAPRMDNVLNNQTLHIRDLTTKVLASKNYTAFSQDARSDTGPQGYLSLEQLHGLLHGLIGGGTGIFTDWKDHIKVPKDDNRSGMVSGGHMGQPEYAAYDPIFMMHHANVDRIFAMWQALNPTAYGTYFKSSTENINAAGNDILAPFKRSLAEDSYWTAADVSDTRTFNYTYPELLKWDTLGPTDKYNRLMDDIKDMYRHNTGLAVLEPGLFTDVKTSFTPVSPNVPSTFSSRLSAARETPLVSSMSAMSVEVPQAIVTGTSTKVVSSAHEAQQPVYAPEHKPKTATTTPYGEPHNPKAHDPATTLYAQPHPAPTTPYGHPQDPKPEHTPTITYGQPDHPSATPYAQPQNPKPDHTPTKTYGQPDHPPATPYVQPQNPKPDHTPTTTYGQPDHPPTTPYAQPQNPQPDHPITTTYGQPRQPATTSYGQPKDEHHDTGSNPGSGKKHFNDWNANIIVEKYAVKTSFFVHIFLGDFAEDPNEWLTDRHLVGSYFVFASNIETTGCANCQRNAENNIRVTGTVPLTGALTDPRFANMNITSLEPETIIPYLQKQLHWRVQTLGGAVVEREAIPSLKVSVVHFPTTAPTDTRGFAVKGEGVTHSAVTAGRAGGAGENDDI